MKTILYWLRNDLRIHDNVILSTKLSSNDRLIPIYIFDNRFNEKHPLGFPRISSYRKKFLLETLSDLKNSFNKLKSDLLIYYGQPEVIIPKIASKYGVDIVYCTKEHSHEEIEHEVLVNKNLGNIPLKCVEQLTLIHPEHLPFDIKNVPDTFSAFRKAVEKELKIRSPFDGPKRLPPLPESFKNNNFDFSLEFTQFHALKMDKRSAFNFRGGETEGLNRLKDYIWNKGLITNYKNTRNGMIGSDYSSKFSPWLALGALSPRIIYSEVNRFEREVLKNESTGWMIFELIWRDYFRFITMKYGNKLFSKSGIKNFSKEYSNSYHLFNKWLSAKTGNDFIDANMKELNATGFMSNRGRQNAASYLVHDLDIDWRWGAAYFESQLIDYDVCSNWGNWMYVAGVGNDPRPNRKFNTSLQARKYDPEYQYRDLWLKPKLLKTG